MNNRLFQRSALNKSGENNESVAGLIFSVMPSVYFHLSVALCMGRDRCDPLSAGQYREALL